MCLIYNIRCVYMVSPFITWPFLMALFYEEEFGVWIYDKKQIIKKQLDGYYPPSRLFSNFI